MADCGENYIDCTKHNESVESLFKRLISVDDEGNLSLNICGCGGGDTPVAGLTSVTYAELVALIGSSGLTPGGFYLLTDFATKHFFSDNNTTLADINTGATEPLILFATSVNNIDSRVYSPSYPQDELNYDWNAANFLDDYHFSDDGATIISGWAGVITFRHDTKLDNSVGYDYRNVKFRRWALNPDTWDSGTTYAAKAIVKDVAGTKVYISLKAANLNNAVTDVAWWVEIVDMTTNKYWAWKSATTNGILVDANDFADFYTFGGGTCYMNHIACEPDNGNYWWTNASLLNNIVFGEDCIMNDIGYGCYEITVGNNFYFNTVGNNFYSNTVGNNFSSNTVWKGFSSNTVGNYFQYNTVGNGFSSNTVGNNFYSNTVGNNFSSNTVGKNFYSNTVGNNFSSNTVGNTFQYNTVLDGITSIDFTLATHIYLDYSKTISKRLDGTAVLTYINNSYVQQIVAATA